MVLSIDPGNKESAYALIDGDYTIAEFGKVDNTEMLRIITRPFPADLDLVIEMVASYGMAVGKEVFDTCVWIGRYQQAATVPVTLMFRKDVKMNLCGQTKAKDANIIQALKDRFGDKGTKANPGWFYGFSKDVWQAYALGVTYLDTISDEKKEV